MPVYQLTPFIIYFSAFSVLSVAKNCINRCKSVKSVVRNQSIKNNKLCETKPISEMPKMVVNAVMTMTNNKKQRTMSYPKQSQTKPNLYVSDRLVRLWWFLRLATNDQRLSTLDVMPLRRQPECEIYIVPFASWAEDNFSPLHPSSCFSPANSRF